MFRVNLADQPDVADQILGRDPEIGCHLVDDMVALRVDSGIVQRIGRTMYPKETSALLKSLRAKFWDFMELLP